MARFYYCYFYSKPFYFIFLLFGIAFNVWDLSSHSQGIEPLFPSMERGVLTTEPQGNPYDCFKMS